MYMIIVKDPQREWQKQMVFFSSSSRHASSRKYRLENTKHKSFEVLLLISKHSFIHCFAPGLAIGAISSSSYYWLVYIYLHGTIPFTTFDCYCLSTTTKNNNSIVHPLCKQRDQKHDEYKYNNDKTTTQTHNRFV